MEKQSEKFHNVVYFHEYLTSLINIKSNNHLIIISFVKALISLKSTIYCPNHTKPNIYHLRLDLILRIIRQIFKIFIFDHY